MPESWELHKLFAHNAESNGDYQSAENYLWQAIEAAAESKSFVKLAICMDSLGDLYFRMKRFSEAETIYNDCLEKQIGAFGLEHPEIAATLNKLANCQNFQSKMKPAEDSLKQALMINLLCFGEGAPQTSTTIRNINSLYARQGKVFDIREVSGWGQAKEQAPEQKEDSICKTCHRPFKGLQCPTCTQFRMTAMNPDELERLPVVCAPKDIRDGTVITLSAVNIDVRLASKFDSFFNVNHVLGKPATRLISKGAALKLSDVDLSG